MNYLERLVERYPALDGMKDTIEEAFQIMKASYENGGKLLVCGNGGSASDSDHIVGELMKGFYKKRPLSEAEKEKFGGLSEHLQGALPAISLAGHPALSTAFLNDVNPEMIFAQQVYGYGLKGDVLIAMTTSGNSANVLNAVRVAKGKGMKVIGFTGHDGGALKALCEKEDVTFIDNGSLVKEEYYTEDGIHMQPDYYTEWVNHMAEVAGL